MAVVPLSDPVTVVVVDDHPVMVQAVADLLAADGMAVVGALPPGPEAITLLQKERPAAVVVGAQRAEGLVLLQGVLSASPQSGAVVYASHSGRPRVSEAVEVGAKGFVLKESPPEDLVRAVQFAATGHCFFDPCLGDELATLNDRAGLTPRECSVLRLLAAGLELEEIGRELFIAPDTVRSDLRKAMAKLDASTRIQAVATAIRRSVIN